MVWRKQVTEQFCYSQKMFCRFCRKNCFENPNVDLQWCPNPTVPPAHGLGRDGGFLHKKTCTMHLMLLEKFFAIFVIIQILHSIEEISTGFYKKFPLLLMTFRFFLIFEILFNAFWITIIFTEQFPFGFWLMGFFCMLMFANGVWHIVWFWFFEKGKRYVPGLCTAFVHVGVFFVFFYTALSQLP